MEHLPGEPASAGIRQGVNLQGQPAQLEVQEVLQHEGVNVGRHRDEDHDQGADEGVLPLVLLDGGVDTQQQADGDGDEQGIDIDQHSGQQAAQDQLHGGLVLLDVPGGTEVAFGDDVFQINAVLSQQRLIIAQSLPAGLDRSCLDPVGGQLTGEQADHHEADGQDDHEGEGHQGQTLQYILEHVELIFHVCIVSFFDGGSEQRKGICAAVLRHRLGRRGPPMIIDGEKQ